MNDPIAAFDIPLEGATCSLAPLEAAIATCTADVIVFLPRVTPLRE